MTRKRCLAPMLFTASALLALTTIAPLGLVQPGFACAAEPAGPEDLDMREEKAFQAACQQAAPSVVRIETVGGMERVSDVLFGSGPTTGVVLDAEGYVVSSAFSFVNKPTSILVRLPDGSRKPAELIATDHNRMIVLLKVRADASLPVPEIAPESGLRVGQWAIAVGRTFESDQPNLTVGVISALRRVWGKAIQTDAIVSPNNYGGPLLDIRGRVMGILVPLSPEATDEMAGVEWYDSGIGFAIPVESIQAVLPKLKKGENLFPGVIGINLAGNLQVGEPVLSACTPGSPAAEAGLKAGDRIVEIDGRKIERAADVKREIASRYAGDRMRVAVQRGNDRVECNVELVAKLPPFQHAALGVLPMRDGEGIAIRHVFPDGPAAAAGLKPADVILSLDGKPAPSADELRNAIGQHKQGDAVVVEYRRGKKTATATAKLGPITEGLPPGELPPAHGKAKPAEGDRPSVGVMTMKAAEFKNEAPAYVPEGYNPNVPCGLIVWLHGPAGYDQKELLARFKPLCDRHDMIFVAPKATEKQKWAPHELMFVLRIIEQVRSQYRIDPARIVVCGQESGGSLAWMAALRGRELVRAVVAIDSPLMGKPPENDPQHRFAVFMTESKRSPKARDIKQGITALREMKIPVTVKDLGEAPRNLSDEETAELVRWIDMLDRI